MKGDYNVYFYLLQQSRYPAMSADVNQLRIMTAAQLLKTPFKPREYLIQRWFREQESIMLYSPPGVGKSFFALGLALAVAGGGQMFDCWSAPQARKVLYVDGEMPIDDIQERIKKLLPAVKGNTEAAQQNLSILSRQAQAADAKFPDLSQDDGQTCLLHQTKGFDLLVLDNLSTLASIYDENSAGNFNDIVKFLLQVKQSKTACLLVHHSNKSGANYRGSTKLATTFEVIIGLEAKQETRPDRHSVTKFILSWDKYRGKRDKTTATPQELTIGDSSNSNRYIWSCEPSPDGQVASMIRLLQSGNCCTQKELAELMGVHESSVSRLIKKAIGEGTLSKGNLRKYFQQGRSARSITDEINELEGVEF
jgi:hypothetical protein